MSSTIGALRVVLGADTAAFDKGLKGANTSLSRFGKQAAVAGAVIATALTGAAIALGVAVRGTLKAMDDFAKTAQKIGVPVKELSALTHAAELSGVSFDTLTVSLGRLSRTMSDAATGVLKPQQSFERLGVSVQNADGTLKGATEVMTAVAERFAGMQDGAAKTALAMEIFGRAGAGLIPLLNLGSVGINKLMQEAEALGITFDTKTAKAAERFNDSLEVLGKVWQGFIVQLTAALAGPLADLAEALRESAVEGEGLYKAGKNVGQTLVGLALDAGGAVTQIRALTIAFTTAIKLMRNASNLNFSGFEAALDEGAEGIRQVRKEWDEFVFRMKAAAADREFLDMFGGDDGLAPALENLREKTRDAAEAQRALNQTMAEGLSLTQMMMTPLEAYGAELQNIARLLDATAISAETASRAQMAAAVGVARTYADAAGQVASTLAGAFQQNKAFAIAEAMMNVAQGITRAYTLPFPLNWAQAAAVAAAGAVQIGAIKSARPGSSGSPRPSAGGGSGKAVSGGGAGGAAPQQDRAVFINLQGGGRYSRAEVEGIIEGLIEAQRDGAKLILSRK